jgi:shikimate kinase
VDRPLVVELVGPAGSGKTTLLRVLATRDARIRAGLRIHRIRHLPLIIQSALSLVPTVFSLLYASPRFLWNNLRYLVRLRTFHSVLRREASRNNRTVIMDEGPVFTLARLTALHDARGASRGFDRCWRRALNQWAHTLDAVIWLDAPDAVLTRRIRDREKAHRIKEQTDRTISEFLARYRSSYGAVMSVLGEGEDGGKVLMFDTASASTDLIADVVLDALGAREARAKGA